MIDPPALTLGEESPGPADLPTLNALIERAIGSWAVTERVKRAALPSYRYEALDLADMRFFTLRDERGAPVGLAAVSPLDGAQDALLLHGLYVDPIRHRQGLGRRLLQSAEAAARQAGAARLVVRAQRDAAPFFAAAGYRPADGDYPYTLNKAFH
ncbi:MAG: GNAT family N-acetyltransferase [Marivibrio sp.]|uniref:GNAT family N-acetyltransferase n=1 Tax=Marivibrio sp. TaxID=2039719 RepID=UPI0032ED823C